MLNINIRNTSPFYKVILLTQFLIVCELGMGLFSLSEPIVYKLLRYAIMAYSSLLLVKNVIKYHRLVSFLQVLFIGWIIILFLKVMPELFNPYKNYIYLKQFVSIYMFVFLIPIFMVSELNTNFFKSLFKLVYALAILYLFIFFPISIATKGFLDPQMEGITTLMGGSILLFMTWPYHNKKKMMIALIAIILLIIIMMLCARRNKVLFFGGGLGLSMALVVFKSKLKKAWKILILCLILLSGILLYFFASNFIYFFDRVLSGMSSREVVIDLFIDDFNRTPDDWIFGRGILGTFDGGILNDEDTGMRDGIENGYLQIILKGGGIWLGLLVLISIGAVFRGLFKSKNLLCKGMALIILLYYVDMIGFGIPGISLKYMMVFISIAGCNSVCLRQCDDAYLTKYVGLK